MSHIGFDHLCCHITMTCTCSFSTLSARTTKHSLWFDFLLLLHVAAILVRAELLWQRLSAVSVGMFGVSEKSNADHKKQRNAVGIHACMHDV